MTIRCLFIESTETDKLYEVTRPDGTYIGVFTSTEIRERLTSRDPDSDPESF